MWMDGWMDEYTTQVLVSLGDELNEWKKLNEQGGMNK
jgi:hypothetical protein